jgi:steroid 5-alpha reductase family enzyme
LAVPAGGAWTVFAPLLITYLLLRVSGVTLLEKDMKKRRPGYREYVASTNAFFPGRPRPGPDFALFIGLTSGVHTPFSLR